MSVPARPAVASSQRRVLTVVSWIPRVVLAVVFVAAGLSKLAGEAAQVQLFDDIGAGQWLRYLVGLCELAGAIGVLVPLLAGLAAIGLGLVMLGATFINVVVLGYSPALTLALLVLAALTVWLRRRHLNPFARPR